MNENISATAAKKESKFSMQYLLQMIKANLLPTVLLTAFWMVLGWLRTAGVQWAILWPLNFLTGALSGLSGSLIGGTIGKTILLILFNSMFRGLIAQRGNWKIRGKATMCELKKEGLSALLSKIPQYSNLKTMLKGGTPKLLGFSGLGLGIALLVYPFITGDGSLVNSMVCIAVSFNVGKQLVKQRGFLISLVNILLEKNSWKTINKDVVNRVIAGFTVGMAVAVPIAAVKSIPGNGIFLWTILAKCMPILIVLVAVMGIFGDKMGNTSKENDAV